MVQVIIFNNLNFKILDIIETKTEKAPLQIGVILIFSKFAFSKIFFKAVCVYRK